MPYAAPRIALVPAARPDPRQRAIALLAASLVAALLGYLLILGLAPSLIGHVAERITSVTLLPDPPPPEQPQPKPHHARKAGAASPPNLRSKATPVVAPKPIIVLPRPVPVIVAPKPASGAQASSGAADVSGPGTGAGGIGNGTGSGGEGDGDGDGDGDSGPIQLSRNLQVSDIRCLRNGECDGSNDVTVYIRFVVGANGRARDCAVTRSSGRPELDRETCAAIVERLRYRPGTDAAGRPTAMNFTGHQRWSGRGDDYDDRNHD